MLFQSRRLFEEEQESVVSETVMNQFSVQARRHVFFIAFNNLEIYISVRNVYYMLNTVPLT
jgi:hypothetical protein